MLCKANGLLRGGVDKALEKGFMASFVWPARGSKGGQLATVGGYCIKREVK